MSKYFNTSSGFDKKQSGRRSAWKTGDIECTIE